MDRLAPQMRLVQITWRDHSADKHQNAWEPISELTNREEVIAYSVGWLVKQDKNFTILASCRSDEFGASTQIIMTGLITKTVDLVPKGRRR